MPAPLSRPPRHAASRLDFKRKPLAIRTLDYRSAPKRSRAALDRVRDEFTEMRGLSLTPEQAARLFDLPRQECAVILDRLVREGFLRRSPDGRYRLPAGSTHDRARR